MISRKIVFAFLFSVAIVAAGFVFLKSGKHASFTVSNLPVLSVQQPEKVIVKEEPLQPVSIVFGGDMMFDRYIRTAMRNHGDGFPLAPLREVFRNADLVVANLEGPITESPSVSETSELGSRENYVFTFPPVTAKLLKDYHIDAVSLGNNHVLNFKESGVESTKRYLAEAGVAEFGSPLSGDDRVLVRDLGGLKVVLVNYNQFVYYGQDKAFEDIAEARQKADVVIVYAHWGKEYEPEEPGVKELAHRFIDAGADAVIGSHPHIVQEKEGYAGKMIYYSLGNLVFDQYFREDTMRGLLVRMTIDPVTKALSYEDIPVVLKRTGETMLAAERVSK